MFWSEWGRDWRSLNFTFYENTSELLFILLYFWKLSSIGRLPECLPQIVRPIRREGHNLLASPFSENPQANKRKTKPSYFKPYVWNVPFSNTHPDTSVYCPYSCSEVLFENRLSSKLETRQKSMPEFSSFFLLIGNTQEHCLHCLWHVTFRQKKECHWMNVYYNSSRGLEFADVRHITHKLASWKLFSDLLGWHWREIAMCIGYTASPNVRERCLSPSRWSGRTVSGRLAYSLPVYPDSLLVLVYPCATGWTAPGFRVLHSNQIGPGSPVHYVHETVFSEVKWSERIVPWSMLLPSTSKPLPIHHWLYSFHFYGRVVFFVIERVPLKNRSSTYDLSSGDYWFESRPEHHVSLLLFFVIFLYPSDKCRKSVWN
jgi:hypothetical protein